MGSKISLLRALPSVERISQNIILQQRPHETVVRASRIKLQQLRSAILQGDLSIVPSEEQICRAILDWLEQTNTAPRPVINATGIVLHTNLGRAPLASPAIQAVCDTAKGYTDLEYCLETGTRGSRNTSVEALLCGLTGCEAALVVNNNAAAILLALTALSFGKQVIVSRGELVEIGDGFRIPEIMRRSGAQLLEVGATNKTHLQDYAQAIDAHTGALLKVHPSNFKMIGFTNAVSMQQLAELGRIHGIPTIYDLGSGAFLQEDAFVDEPTVQEALKQGADVICFSGDKLLGGPQAGILLGKADWIEKMKRDPLARALRIDKLSLAALYATLKLYESQETVREKIPTLRMLCAKPQELQAKAAQLCRLLQDAACHIEIAQTTRPAGGGSLPGQTLPAFVVKVQPKAVSVEELQRFLRAYQTAIITRIHDGELLIDPSTVTEEELPVVAQAVQEGCGVCSI